MYKIEFHEWCDIVRLYEVISERAKKNSVGVSHYTKHIKWYCDGKPVNELLNPYHKLVIGECPWYIQFRRNSDATVFKLRYGL